MSQEEAAILELFSMTTDRYFTLMQWWVSISIGLVAIAHFASDKLNLFLITALIGLYLAYTAYMSSILATTGQLLASLTGALGQLQDHGNELSLAGQQVLSLNQQPGFMMTIGGVGFVAAVFGGLLTTVSYVVYCYWKVRRAPVRGQAS